MLWAHSAGWLAVALKHLATLKTAFGVCRRLFFFAFVFFPYIPGYGGNEPVVYPSALAYIEGQQLYKLNSAIEEVQELIASGVWQPIDFDNKLQPGNRHANVPLLRQRLKLSGDYQGYVSADPLLFDRQLSDAVKRLQARYGLAITGSLDRLTRRALNQTPQEQLQLLKQARVAWIEIPGFDQQKLVWVNIPEARVTAIEADSIVLNLPAIVGKPERPTPSLYSRVNRVIVNPPWSVPRSIATKDLLPKQQADPGFFAANHIRVFSGWNEPVKEIDSSTIDWSALNQDNFPYRLKQDPGPDNALGKFKFSFPNDYDVYLHDTPSKALLGLSYRSLSSGCVRVESPEQLARWLLTDNAALEKSLSQSSAKTQSLRVESPATIAMVYITAWVSPDGSINFRHDIYSGSEAAN